MPQPSRRGLRALAIQLCLAVSAASAQKRLLFAKDFDSWRTINS
jgi:hypothetical protein